MVIHEHTGTRNDLGLSASRGVIPRPTSSFCSQCLRLPSVLAAARASMGAGAPGSIAQ